MKRKIFKRGDIDFSRDDIHRFLPWLVAVMACLTTLLLCISISIGGWIENRHQSYAANFTVNIPAARSDDKTVAEVITLIKNTPQVKQVKPISEQDLKAVMQDWLGSSDISQLPMPTVLEVTIEQDAADNFDHAALAKKIRALASGSQIDAHETWVKSFASFSAVLSGVLFSLSAIIMIAMAAAVIFSARTALRLHARTVSLLHSIGAEDSYISRQFQRDTLRTTLPGLTLGTAAAAILYWAGGAYAASLPASVMPSLAIHAGHIALFILLPITCALAASFVARLAVLKQLKRTL